MAISCVGWVTNHFVGTRFPGQSDITAAVGYVLLALHLLALLVTASATARLLLASLRTYMVVYSMVTPLSSW